MEVRDVVKRVEALREHGLITETVCQAYIEGCEDSFEPEAYDAMTDRELLDDIRLFEHVIGEDL